MDSNSKGVNGKGGISMTETQRTQNDVIISISGDHDDDKDSKISSPNASKDQIAKASVESPNKLSNDSTFRHRNTVSSPEIVNQLNSSPDKPPRIPKTETLTRRKSLSRSVYSKPKSRFGEQPVPIDSKMFEERTELIEEYVASNQCSPVTKSGANGFSPPKVISRNVSITPKAPLMASPGGLGGVDDGEEIYNKVKDRKRLRYKKLKAKVLIEWMLFVCILVGLISSLTVHKLHNTKLWGLLIWKWLLLILVTFSGLLVTRWLVRFLVLLIELNYLLKKKVLYFLYGLKKSVQVCIWLGVVLVTWVLLFKDGVDDESPVTSKILDFVTWTIASSLIGSFFWVLKTLLLKILASKFHVNTFFDRIQESIFHQYILLTLSGPPIMELEEMAGKTKSNLSQLSFRAGKKGKDGNKKEKDRNEVIDINELHQMKQEKVSAWTMKMLVDVISSSGLTTLSNTIDESVYGGDEKTDKEITNEEEAIAAAYHIFRNVAQPGSNYIDELDLRRFMIREEVDFVFPMIDAAETGQIDRKALTDWVVKVYKGRKALAHALNDTKTAVKQLNKLVTVVLVIVMIIVWLLLTGIATTKVLVLLSSQLVLAVFMFGNTCKTIFEAIVFVFVMHPFDVGDRCVIDGMVVEEMNILTTVFLKFDNEKIYYPNSVLATKPIGNFYRSPDMSDSLEFSIDFKTPMEKIGSLKEKIKRYLETNPQHWHPNHNVVVKEIENVNKIKIALIFNHTMNFQDFAERNRRKSNLVLEMKRIFEELNIRYDLLPQRVHLVESMTEMCK
nr:mechanosensitive ion channel protein A058645 [Torenia fournieri]